MSGFGLADAARMAREALDGGAAVALGVVVAAPGTPELVGRRVAWDGMSLHGGLGDTALDAAVRTELGDPKAAGVRSIAGADIELFVERFEPPPELVVVGAGHIAIPLARLGKLLGWRVVVLDDRPAFAAAARFPGADRVEVIDADDPFADVPVGPRSRIVLVTRGHRYDYACLKELARASAEPAYLGMIGSRRRVRAAFEQLAAQGVERAWIERVHAPVGLDIGAETPAEIAVAVAAEIVLAARGGSGAPLRDRARVVRYVRSLAGEAAP